MKEDWSITALLVLALAVLFYLGYVSISPPENPFQISPQPPAAASVTRSTDSAGLSSYSAAPVTAPGTEREKMIAAAIVKYGDRLVVREFIADLKNDPCASKAIADEKPADLAGTLSAARRAGCLDRLKLKYAFRPQFIKLMAEVMSDPDVRPLLQSPPEEPPGPGEFSTSTARRAFPR